MNQSPLPCQGCGAPLPSPEAVCACCEAELSAELAAPAARYVCPHCHQRFAALAQVPWPPQVPWWRPTSMRLQCPHCDTPLRDRHAVQPPTWLVIATFGVALYTQLIAAGWLRLLGIALAIALFAPLIWSALKIRKDMDNPHRFIVGSYRFWARGDEKLQRARQRLGGPPR